MTGDANARVLTLEELIERARNRPLDYFWIEIRGEDFLFCLLPLAKCESKMFFDLPDTAYGRNFADYWKTWRCWSARPMDSAREAIPWEE